MVPAVYRSQLLSHQEIHSLEFKIGQLPNAKSPGRGSHLNQLEGHGRAR